MDNGYIPKTENELEIWMKENCFNFNHYSINGSAIFEGFGIDRIGGRFIWYYTERGEKNNLAYFQSESEIVEYAFNHIKSDKWAKAYCIGFTTSKDEKEEIANVLREMGLEYFQDQIPYYGLERPVFRTFVLGCDINKTEHLKDKYFKKK